MAGENVLPIPRFEAPPAFLEKSPAQQHITQVEAGLRVTVVQPEGRAIAALRLVFPFHGRQQHSEIRPGGRRIRRQKKGIPVHRLRFGEALAFHEEHTQVQMDLDGIGKQGDGLPVARFRFRHIPVLLPQQRQVGQRLAEIGDQRQNPPEAFLGPLAIPRVHEAIALEKQGFSPSPFLLGFNFALLDHRALSRFCTP